MRTLLVSVALLALGVGPSLADTLEEAMSAAAETNPSLAAERQRLRAAREALPQAWAEALPQVSAQGLALRSDRDGEAPGIDTPSHESWSAAATGSQLLFGSGRVLASTRAARAQIRGAVANYDFVLQTLLLDVTRAYGDVRQAQAVVAARETTVANLTRLYQFAQAQFDAGVVTRTDVAQSQARLAQARTQLVQAQGGLAAAVQAYQRLVGHPPSALETPGLTENLPADLEAALVAASRDSPLLRRAAAAADFADANVDLAAAQGRARVTFEGSLGEAANFNDDLSDATTDSVGVRVVVPLFQGGLIGSRTRQQRALRAASNLEVAAALRGVQESVTNAWTGLASARAAVQSAREQVEASELAYQGVRLEQEVGLRSTVEVLDQEQDLLTARLALAQAERDLIVAERQMLAAMGALTVPQGER